MDFYFPDSQDQIEPTFDFVAEERSPFRVRQRDDRYAHEIHKKPVYSGVLVSKSIVDGLGGTSGPLYATGLLRGRRDAYHRSGLTIAMTLATGTAVLQLVSGIGSITVSEQTGGVAYWAHIGGFAAGLILAFLLRPFVNGPTRFSTA